MTLRRCGLAAIPLKIAFVRSKHAEAGRTGEEHVIGYAEEKPMFHDSRNDIEQIRQGFHIRYRAKRAIGDQMPAIGAVQARPEPCGEA